MYIYNLFNMEINYIKSYYENNHDKGFLIIDNYFKNGRFIVNEFALKVENFKVLKNSKAFVNDLLEEYNELLNDYREITKYFLFARHYNHFRETEFHDKVLELETQLVNIYENLLIE